MMAMQPVQGMYMQPQQVTMVPQVTMMPQPQVVYPGSPPPMMAPLQMPMPQQQYPQQYPQQHPQQQQPQPQMAQDRAAPQAPKQASIQMPPPAPTGGLTGPTKADANGLVNRSRVIKDPTPWWNQSYMVPHEAIRYWMEKMELHVVTNPNFDLVAYPWKAENFFTWYNDYFHSFVYHHHDLEEQVATPWMAKKGLVFPDKIMHDHVALMAALDKVQTMEQEYRSIVRSGAADRDQRVRDLTQRLKAHIVQMNADMRDHLAEEEILYPPALRDGVTEKEYKSLEMTIIKSFTMAENEKYMPLICHTVREWGGAALLMKFESQIPGPIRYFLNKNWKPKFYNYTEPLLDSLTMTTEPRLVKPSPGCCTIS